MLERSGLEVLAAPDGEAAVEIFAARSFEIVAVILDLVMPGRSGEEVLAEIRARRPDCPVLLCSGYSGSEAPRPVSDGLVRFISKPYTPEQLVATLRELLTRANH